jgi:hypothetical protein
MRVKALAIRYPCQRSFGIIHKKGSPFRKRKEEYMNRGPELIAIEKWAEFTRADV